MKESSHSLAKYKKIQKKIAPRQKESANLDLMFSS